MKIILLVALLVLGMIIGLNLKDGNRDRDVEQGAASYPTTGVAPTLTTVTDVQRELVALGFDIEVDGVLGPKTRWAWEQAEANQMASEYMTESGGLE